MTADTSPGRPHDEPAADLPNVPLLDEAIEFDKLDAKPTWRGWIHAGTFPLAILLGIVLIAAADGAAAKISSSVFVASSLLLFGISALYHRINWTPSTKAVFKRLDHANIFLLIAGSYTPITVLALPHDKSVMLLWLVWGGAGLVSCSGCSGSGRHGGCTCRCTCCSGTPRSSSSSTSSRRTRP